MTPRRSWIIWLVICMHVNWAVCLFASPAPMGVTSIHELTLFFGTRPFLLATWMIVAAIFAGASVFIGGWRMLLLAAPQQFLLFLSAGGAAAAILASQYADGVPRPMAFIAADQMLYLFLAALHFTAVCEEWIIRYGRALAKRINAWMT